VRTFENLLCLGISEKLQLKGITAAPLSRVP
jgi:hypothetical protein